MKNNKGFSLVELIIVIAIMAVLVGVLAPTYLQYVEKSKKSNDVSTVDSVVNACEIGAIDPEVMTDTTDRLVITISDSANMTIEAYKGQTENDTSAWKNAVVAAVGSDVKFKSTNWNGSVVIEATRNAATGKVEFKYGSSSSDAFSTYATSLTKVKSAS